MGSTLTRRRLLAASLTFALGCSEGHIAGSNASPGSGGGGVGTPQSGGGAGAGPEDDAGRRPDLGGTRVDAMPPAADATHAGGDGALGDAIPGRPDAHAAPADAAPLPPAVPLDAAPDRWTPVMIDGMTCADGTPTGVAVNPAPEAAVAPRVFIYLMGGGACWDEDSCYDHPRATSIAEPALPQAFVGSDLTGAPFFDRRRVDNPFAGDHLVFVPYCTGDLHAGDRTAVYGGRQTRHGGARNFQRLAARLAAAWPATTRVVLAGGSAGGYGAVLNWDRALDAFPRARVDVVDDSGPPFPPPHFAPALLADWGGAWGLAATVPADCPTCATDLSAHVAHGLARARGGRIGLLSSVGDAVIASYLGLDAVGIGRGLAALSRNAPVGFGAFLVPGDGHVLLGGPFIAGGQDAFGWLTHMLSDDAAWGSVGPDEQPPCDALADCAACAVCAAQRPCADTYAACSAVSGCVDAVVCALGCPAADQNCILACAAANGGATPAAAALYGCVRCDTCAARCGACP